MKQMTKKELIDYFIQQYGDSKILGRYISVEEIRKRLNENIKEVTYKTGEIRQAEGCFNSKSRTVNIDLDFIQRNDSSVELVIVHELLHALSFSEKKQDNIDIDKNGLRMTQKQNNTDQKQNVFWGTGLDEGFTEFLAEKTVFERLIEMSKKSKSREEKILIMEKISSVAKGTGAYIDQKDFVGVLTALYSDDYLSNKYFMKLQDDQEVENPFKYFFQEISLGREILKEAIDSLDILTALGAMNNFKSSKEQQERYKQTRKRVFNKIEKLIITTLENEKDENVLRIKMQKVLEVFSKSLSNMDINYRVNPDCVMHLNTPRIANALQEILINENSGMSLGTMVDTYIRLTEPTEPLSQERGTAYKEWEHSIENYCINKGIIDESEVKKAGMLSHILQCYRDELRDMQDQDFKELLSQFRYAKVGSHYELAYIGDNKKIWAGTHELLFDEDGEIALTYGMFPSGEEWIYTTLIDASSSKIDREKMENIRLQVQNISNNSERKIKRAMVLGNDVILYYGGIDDRIVYSINNDGLLVLSEVGVLRRINDDMSELDIILQQETANVSITEMMNEANSMHGILEEKIKKSNEQSIEEKIDSK